MLEYIITHDNPKSPTSEAYRVLRTNILFSNVDRPPKTIVVTSFGNGEGKTTTVVNLAVTFLQQGSRVLLIDGDLRKPKIHSFFRLKNEDGLTNLLYSHENYRKYVKQDPVRNLDVIVCGYIPQNPSELLMSASMKRFLAQVSEDYDAVFIDSPPIGMVTDAAVLSSMADGTILVAASGHVSAAALLSAKDALDRVNANILGVVLTKIKKSAGDYRQYRYYEESRRIKK